ncbi:hypothetical protein ACVWYN_000030 [Pedobacter sp. UYP24]
MKIVILTSVILYAAFWVWLYLEAKRATVLED